MRRVVIVLATIMTLAMLYWLFQQVMDGPDAGWSSGPRVRGAGSDVGWLMWAVIFAIAAAVWALRNWNRESDVLDAPKRRRRRKRRD
jgi:hypothetical protein